MLLTGWYSFFTFAYPRGWKGWATSLSKSVVLSVSRNHGNLSKPPNISIYSGNKDSLREYKETAKLIAKYVRKDTYTFHHLKHSDIKKESWPLSTKLLILAVDAVYDGLEGVVQRYVASGGAVLSLGSRIDEGYLSVCTSHSPVSACAVISCDDLLNVSAVWNKKWYAVEKEVENFSMRKLVYSEDKVVVVELEHKETFGRLILSQVLFQHNENHVVDQSSVARLQQSESDRQQILAKLLQACGLLTNDHKESKEQEFTAATLHFFSEDQRLKFESVIFPRLKDGKLPSPTVTLEFCGDVTNVTRHASIDYLPVITAPSADNFDLRAYESHLKTAVLGRILLHVDFVPSTQPLLDGLMFSLTNEMGMVAIANKMTSGKGRGGNTWLSPLGCAMFSFHLRVETGTTLGSHPAFLQHIATTAVVLAVQSINGYEKLNLRIKWPNDLYFGTETKIGGVLVNSSVVGKAMHCVVGIGVNVTNSLPTTCINDIISAYNVENHQQLTPLSVPEFIARTLTTMETLLQQFEEAGVAAFKQQYYQYWLHGDSVVRVADRGEEQVRITGLDEHGYLEVACESGERWSLQPDGNTFDMMKGLISLKS